MLTVLIQKHAETLMPAAKMRALHALLHLRMPRMHGVHDARDGDGLGHDGESIGIVGGHVGLHEHALAVEARHFHAFHGALVHDLVVGKLILHALQSERVPEKGIPYLLRLRGHGGKRRKHGVLGIAFQNAQPHVAGKPGPEDKSAHDILFVHPSSSGIKRLVAFKGCGLTGKVPAGTAQSSPSRLFTASSRKPTTLRPSGTTSVGKEPRGLCERSVVMISLLAGSEKSST